MSDQKIVCEKLGEKRVNATECSGKRVPHKELHKKWGDKQTRGVKDEDRSCELKERKNADALSHKSTIRIGQRSLLSTRNSLALICISWLFRAFRRATA